MTTQELNDLMNLLPDTGAISTELVSRSPYSILKKYAEAITKKYPKKLAGIPTETSADNNVIRYSLHLWASIGDGYFHTLLDIKPSLSGEDKNSIGYPCKVHLYKRENITDSREAKTPEELENILKDVFRDPFTSNLIIQLLVAVEQQGENKDEQA